MNSNQLYINPWIYRIFLLLGFVIRVFHLDNRIYSPHAWRQSDTANFIWDYYQNGIDLFEPSVCWMGGYKLVIFEFPLFEAICALFYHVFGASHLTAKIVFLVFFIGSAWMFYLLVKLILNQSTARIALLVYLFMPLSLFYGQALHIDYPVLLCCFGMCYYMVRAIRQSNRFDLTIASIFTLLALVVKAPYAVIFALPLIYEAIRKRKIKWLLVNSYFLILPLVLFYFWQRYVFMTNGNAPDWDFIIGYRKFTHNAGWYYGTLEQRLDIDNWLVLKDRFFDDLLGISGLILLVLGFWRLKKNWFIILWIAGAMLYMLIFFNLNIVHNYYQIPFVPLCAILIALGIDQCARFKPSFTNWIVLLLLSFFALESIRFSERNYFVSDDKRESIGENISKRTNDGDLVIVNYANIDSKCPNYLYAAKRNGWQLLSYGLKASMVYELMEEGADYFVTIRNSPMTGEMQGFLSSFPQEKIEIDGVDTLYMYELNYSHIWDFMPDEEKARIEKTGYENW